MTATIPLSRGLVALIDDDDAARVTAAGPWHYNPRGKGYAQRNVRKPNGGKSTESLHTFVTGWAYVDHRDGDGLNNQRSNLRQSDAQTNAANRLRRRDNSSGFKGVFPNRAGGQPWKAEIGAGSSKHYLGVFSSAEDAARAYDAAALEFHGDFAALNFPKEIAS